jgi:hypothetical protein
MPDPFLILRGANPVTEEQLTEVASPSALEETLEQALSLAPARRVARWPRRPARPVRQRRTALALAGLAVVGLAWTVYVATRQPTTSLTIGCYAAADLRSHTEVVGSDGRPPTEVCEDLWRRGVFGPGPVPPLVACTLSSGVVGVFPMAGSDTCAGLGTALPTSLPPPSNPPEQDPIALRDALTAAFRAEACIAEPQARQIVNRQLAARNLSDWTVEVTGAFSADRPCASIGLDLAGKKVLLIPAPRS